MIQSFSELQYKDSVNTFHIVDAMRSMVHSDRDVPVRLEAAIALQTLLKHQHSGIIICVSRDIILHPFNGLFSRTTWVSRHQNGKQFWILMKQDMMEWQWHQLDHMQIIYTLFKTDNHASTSSLNFLQAGCCSSRRQTNSVKALKAITQYNKDIITVFCKAAKAVLHTEYNILKIIPNNNKLNKV